MKLFENSKKYTAHLGQFEYNVFPFGLSNTPSNFQQFISEIFNELLGKNEINLYIDDILIASITINDHLSTFR